RVVDQELRARVAGASAVQEEARPTQDRVVAASVRHRAGTAEQLCLAGDEDPASLARHIDALGGEVLRRQAPTLDPTAEDPQPARVEVDAAHDQSGERIRVVRTE